MTDADDGRSGSPDARHISDVAELRTAAHILRDRAASTVGGEWFTSDECYGLDRDDAAWIALVSPLLGPVLADWLDAEARKTELANQQFGAGAAVRFRCEDQALAVARVINQAAG